MMLTLAAGALALSSAPEIVEARFPICGEGRRVTCIVDGDTFWFKREKFRLVDIDAPEVSRPGCEGEARLGREATFRLAMLMNAGGFQIERKGRDRLRENAGAGFALWTVSRQSADICRAGEPMGGESEMVQMRGHNGAGGRTVC